MDAVGSVGRQFALAIAAKDVDRLQQLLAPDIDFRGLTPSKFWEAGDIAAVLDVLFESWFAPDERIDTVLEVDEKDAVEDTGHVSYRFAVTTPDGAHTVEQQAYYRTEGDRISYLRVLCSGMRAVSDATAQG